MIDRPNHAKMKLIERYTEIKSALEASVANGRPPCSVLAGDLMTVAEQLHCTEAAETWLRELAEQQQEKPTGPFSGVSGCT